MRTRTFFSLALASSVLVTSAVAFERDASACGGCFAPLENNTVVTDHRMILSIGAGTTTLYDQIRYQGSPSSFAWVLPIAGTAKVGLSSEALFQTLDQLTQTQVQAPPRNCPPPPQCGLSAPSASFAADAGMASKNGDVTVTKQEVVGPYETVQLHSTNPLALSDWLTAHGYAIPSEIEPVIAAYVKDGFDFLALKLVPGQSVRAMQPVRITTAGPSPTLPLRMVAAGTGATVGITLWVLGEGRYEPQNFPSFTIKSQDIAWSWASNSSNFTKVREAKNDALGGSAWELESSLSMHTANVRSRVLGQTYDEPNDDQSGPSPYPYPPPVLDAGADAAPANKPSAYALATEDLDVLFAFSHGGGMFRTTRMRSDLGRASLANDLKLSASSDQSEIANVRIVTNESDEPQCAYYRGCEYAGTAPRSVAAARNDTGGGCSAAVSTASTSSSLAGGMLAVAALVGLGRTRRRRR